MWRSDSKILVSSRDIARVFEKEHYNVVRDIRGLGVSSEFNALNFEGVEYADG
jgi:anti-repressor protein